MRGVVGHGEEAGQYLLAQILGEGLAFLVAALALALEPVAEHLVEEHRRGAPGENGGTVERLGDRGFAQRLKTLAQFAHGGFHLRLAGRPSTVSASKVWSRRGPCRRRRG